MERIASAVKDLPLRELHLCPECYLVTWTDASGFQVRQGVPVKDGPRLPRDRESRIKGCRARASVYRHLTNTGAGFAHCPISRFPLSDWRRGPESEPVNKGLRFHSRTIPS